MEGRERLERVVFARNTLRGEPFAQTAHATGEEKDGTRGLVAMLSQRGMTTISFDGWERIDRVEVARGQAAAKPREELVHIPDMLAAAD